MKTTTIRFCLGSPDEGSYIGLTCDVDISFDKNRKEYVLIGDGAEGRADCHINAALNWIIDRLKLETELVEL